MARAAPGASLGARWATGCGQIVSLWATFRAGHEAELRRISHVSGGTGEYRATAAEKQRAAQETKSQKERKEIRAKSKVEELKLKAKELTFAAQIPNTIGCVTGQPIINRSVCDMAAVSTAWQRPAKISPLAPRVQDFTGTQRKANDLDGDMDSPNGCSVDTENNLVYWNRSPVDAPIPGGEANEDNAPICFVSGWL